MDKKKLSKAELREKREKEGDTFEKKIISYFTDFNLEKLHELSEIIQTRNRKYVLNEKRILKSLLEIYKTSTNESQKTHIIDFISRFNNYNGPHEHKPSISLFFPSKSKLKIFLHKLSKARKYCYVCIYTISNNEISAMLWYLHNKGVDVRIISDNETTTHMGNDVYDLAECGVNIRIDDKKESRIHHKFAVIDDKYYINGSFNWTVQAVKQNFENMVVSYEKKLIFDFKEEFLRIWDIVKHGTVEKGNSDLPWRYKKFIKK